ncbi:MAG: tetratricopeptide repeat protein, partial [Anaerolineae bacterium]|nr:tetratricopeptide repeat protein [Anaerolineae bacterium]
GLWNKALGELRDLLAREPYRLDLRVTLARTLWRARRREEAARAAQAILDQAPNCLVARLILGAYWCQEGRDEEGRELLQGAQELDPENREAARLLAGESPLRLREPCLEATGVAAEDVEEEEATPEQWPLSGGPSPAEPAPTAAASPVEELQPEEEHIVAPPSAALEKLLAGATDDQEEPEEEVPSGPPDEVAAEAAAGEPLPGPAAEGDAPYASEPAPEGPAAEEMPALLSPVAVLRRRLETAPDDHEARLALARALADSGQLDEALLLYDSLASPASGLLERVLADLEAVAATNAEHIGLRELMGDAYARAGRFQQAMEMYRWLLARDDRSDVAGGHA